MTCPICADLAVAGKEQDHPDYPDPQVGDLYHGQFNPDDPNDPVWTYDGGEDD